MARWVNPHLPTFRKANFGGYYWVADQVEVATDIKLPEAWIAPPEVRELREELPAPCWLPAGTPWVGS